MRENNNGGMDDLYFPFLSSICFFLILTVNHFIITIHIYVSQATDLGPVTLSYIPTPHLHSLPRMRPYE